MNPCTECKVSLLCLSQTHDHFGNHECGHRWIVNIHSGTRKKWIRYAVPVDCNAVFTEVAVCSICGPIATMGEKREHLR